MHYLRLSRLLLIIVLLAACSKPYKNLTQQQELTESIIQYKPEYERELYRCVVDGRFLFKKFHLSGLLLFKKMEGGQTRVAFSNEMGLSFFDFSWDKNDSFTVNQIIPQLDKPAIVKLLQKDFELLLMKRLDTATEVRFTDGNRMLHRISLDKGFAYYILDSYRIERIENVGRSKVITMDLSGNRVRNSMPENMKIDHYKANFTITLQKMKQDVDE